MRAIIGGAAGLCVSYSAFGQAVPAPIKATKLFENRALLAGDGRNIGLAIAGEALMTIDGGLPDRADDLQKTVAAIDSHKLRTLLNTHWHLDHTGSNEMLSRAGVKIVARENTKKWLNGFYPATVGMFKPPHGVGMAYPSVLRHHKSAGPRRRNSVC